MTDNNNFPLDIMWEHFNTNNALRNRNSTLTWHHNFNNMFREFIFQNRNRRIKRRFEDLLDEFEDSYQATPDFLGRDLTAGEWVDIKETCEKLEKHYEDRMKMTKRMKEYIVVHRMDQNNNNTQRQNNRRNNVNINNTNNNNTNNIQQRSDNLDRNITNTEFQNNNTKEIFSQKMIKTFTPRQQKYLIKIRSQIYDSRKLLRWLRSRHSNIRRHLMNARVRTNDMNNSTGMQSPMRHNLTYGELRKINEHAQR